MQKELLETATLVREGGGNWARGQGESSNALNTGVAHDLSGDWVTSSGCLIVRGHRNPHACWEANGGPSLGQEARLLLRSNAGRVPATEIQPGPK